MTTPRAERTRARLQACALELFTAQGYDATTVEQIATAAGVSHMTFFRQFPTKESVLLEDPYDPLIGEAVRTQPTDLPPLERVRRGLLGAWEAVPPSVDDETRRRVSIMAVHPGLRAKAWQNNQRTEQVIVEALMAAGTSRLEATVAAGACLGAIMAALVQWGSTDDDAPLGAQQRDGEGGGHRGPPVGSSWVIAVTMYAPSGASSSVVPHWTRAAMIAPRHAPAATVASRREVPAAIRASTITCSVRWLFSHALARSPGCTAMIDTRFRVSASTGGGTADQAPSKPRRTRSSGGRSVGWARTGSAISGSYGSSTSTDSLVGKCRKNVMCDTPAAVAICSTVVAS